MNTPPGTILVVEDEAQIRKFPHISLKVTVQGVGYRLAVSE